MNGEGESRDGIRKENEEGIMRRLFERRLGSPKGHRYAERTKLYSSCTQKLLLLLKLGFTMPAYHELYFTLNE